MNPLPCVLLLHLTDEGQHYDWLLGDPRNPRGRLWTAHCQHPSATWAQLRTWTVQEIAPHRRKYLRFQGPLPPLEGRSRGRVVRVDRGSFHPIQWGPRRRLIDLKLQHFSGRLLLERLDGTHWRVRIVR